MERLITYQNAASGGAWREVAQDIVAVPFWRPEFCREVIAAADLLNEFKPYGPDVEKNSAPGQELRIHRISPRFAENYERHVQQHIYPIIRKHWWPISIGKVRMPFLVRYSGDTQTSMDPHHDSSLVSMVVRLNDDYTGGMLTFPRQGWNTAGVEVGEAILFPGKVTHVHWVSPLTSGVRYVMTGWFADTSSEPHDAVVAS